MKDKIESPPCRANGTGPVSVGLCFPLLDGFPLDGNGPVSSWSQSQSWLPPTEVPPPPLHGTVKQTIFYDEMKEGMGCRLVFLFFYHSDL